MTARWMRRTLNVHPPYGGAGIHVDEPADDFRFARAEGSVVARVRRQIHVSRKWQTADAPVAAEP